MNTNDRNTLKQEILRTIRNSGLEGITAAELGRKYDLDPRVIVRYVAELMNTYTDIRMPPSRTRNLGIRSVHGEGYSGDIKEAIIRELKDSDGLTIKDIQERLKLTARTVKSALHEIAVEHIELNVPPVGSKRGYIWTPIKEPVSDEIPLSDLEAIIAAFKPRTKPEPIPTPAPDPVEPIAAIDDAEPHAGDIWRVPKGGRYLTSVGTKAKYELFVVLTKSENYVVGVFLHVENAGYPYPRFAYIWHDSDDEWVGNVQRLCTKPADVLSELVCRLPADDFAAFQEQVATALGLTAGPVAELQSYEERPVAKKEYTIGELEATVAKLQAENDAFRYSLACIGKAVKEG